jgi:hypothetical protein
VWGSNNASNLLTLSTASNAYAASNGQSNWNYASNTAVWSSNSLSNYLTSTSAATLYAASNRQSNWNYASNTSVWSSNQFSNYSTTILANSAYASSNLLSNLVYGGYAFSNLQVIGNARIQGDLQINGSTTIINTNQSNTEQLIITNDGTGPALVVNQKGIQPVVDMQDDGVSVLYIADGGFVGLGNSNPQYRLDVAGTTSATAIREGGIDLVAKYAASNGQSNWNYASNTAVYASNAAVWGSNAHSNYLSLATASNAYAASNAQSNWNYASNTST